MPVIEPAELTELLGEMADRFENSRLPNRDCPDTFGWGQFLDVSRTNYQTGPYGTCAGLMVLCLAGRHESNTALKAIQLLRYYWGLRETDNGYAQRFSQNLRVASLYLALRLFSLSEEDDMVVEVRSFLYGSTIQDESWWGNYWLSGSCRDEIPSKFTTSITLLCLSLLSPREHLHDELLIRSSNNLEEKLAESQTLLKSEEAAALASVLSVKHKFDNKKARARAKQIALKSDIDIEDLGPYFFDFEFCDGTTVEPHRDYYFLPVAIVRAIAGFQDGAPADLRLYAENVLTAIVENLRSNDGLYRPSSSDLHRVTTFHQAWVAILLKLAEQQFRKNAVGRKLWYSLRRRRTDRPWADHILSFGLLFATAANAFLGSPMSKVYAALLLLFASYFGGIDSLKRIVRRITGVI